MEEKELLSGHREGERDALELLYEKNTGLVHHVLKRFAGRGGADMEDLFPDRCDGDW